MSSAYGATVGGGSTGTLGDEAGQRGGGAAGSRLRLVKLPDAPARDESAADADDGCQQQDPEDPRAHRDRV